VEARDAARPAEEKSLVVCEAMELSGIFLFALRVKVALGKVVTCCVPLLAETLSFLDELWPVD
jgi:hypothetical protein